jgi:hypothetical protein
MAKKEKLEKSKTFDTCDEALEYIERLRVKHLTGNLHSAPIERDKYSWSVTWKEKETK